MGIAQQLLFSWVGEGEGAKLDVFGGWWIGRGEIKKIGLLKIHFRPCPATFIKCQGYSSIGAHPQTSLKFRKSAKIGLSTPKSQSSGFYLRFDYLCWWWLTWIGYLTRPWASSWTACATGGSPRTSTATSSAWVITSVQISPNITWYESLFCVCVCDMCWI